MPTTAFTLDLTDRVALVTGGSSGIGRSICSAFAQHGAHVVVADLQSEPREGGTPIVDHINAELDGSATYVECDVTDREQIEAAIAAAVDRGGLDVLVNNAGIFAESAIGDADLDEFDRIMEINVKGVYMCAQAGAAVMTQQDRGGSIINLSSVAGLQGTAPYSAYCASKGAVRLLTYALAEELGGSNVRVNAIHPGVIATSMTTDDVPLLGGESEEQFLQQIPLARFGEPEDVAGVALYLASDLSAYVSGASIVVDGGMSRF
jgi:NAD(P)-dependent dehydrogenase (short-subunit alcohol dehydrogenase family)